MQLPSRACCRLPRPGLPPSPSAVTLLTWLPPPLQVTFEISKQEDSQVPIWIIVGSTLGGLLLLALLVLALWKVRPCRAGTQAASRLVSPGLGL